MSLTVENSFRVFGQPGSEKSHLLIAIGAALLNRQERFVKFRILEES
jgi:DNA replication protein DnaC